MHKLLVLTMDGTDSVQVLGNVPQWELACVKRNSAYLANNVTPDQSADVGSTIHGARHSMGIYPQAWRVGTPEKRSLAPGLLYTAGNAGINYEATNASYFTKSWADSLVTAGIVSSYRFIPSANPLIVTFIAILQPEWTVVMEGAGLKPEDKTVTSGSVYQYCNPTAIAQIYSPATNYYDGSPEGKLATDYSAWCGEVLTWSYYNTETVTEGDGLTANRLLEIVSAVQEGFANAN